MTMSDTPKTFGQEIAFSLEEFVKDVKSGMDLSTKYPVCFRKVEYRHGRMVISPEMREHLLCPFPESEPDL